MGFLDSVTKFTTGVAEKTKGNVDVFSLNQQISSTEKEISDAYKQLGSKYYDLHKEDPEESLAGFITAITDNYAKIERLKVEIEKKKATLYSWDLTDLNNGFMANGPYGCIKKIRKSEILKIYSYHTTACYNGIMCSIIGPNLITGKYFIETDDWINITKNAMDKELLHKVEEYGFERGREIGHGMFTYVKNVFLYDPDLKIFEERKEIDINML